MDSRNQYHKDRKLAPQPSKQRQNSRYYKLPPRAFAEGDGMHENLSMDG
jgi:hypothetical protein